MDFFAILAITCALVALPFILVDAIRGRKD